MPSASVSSAMDVKPGDLASERRANLKSAGMAKRQPMQGGKQGAMRRWIAEQRVCRGSPVSLTHGRSARRNFGARSAATASFRFWNLGFPKTGKLFRAQGYHGIDFRCAARRKEA